MEPNRPNPEAPQPPKSAAPVGAVTPAAGAPARPAFLSAENLDNIGELLIGDQTFRVAGKVERTPGGGLRFRERDRDGYASSWIELREAAVIGVRYTDRPK